MGKAGPQETPRGNTRARARRASVGENENTAYRVFSVGASSQSGVTRNTFIVVIITLNYKLKYKNAMTTESQNNEKSVRVNALYVHCTQTHNQINTIRLKEDSCDFMK